MEEEEDRDREIEVKSLTGESTSVFVSSNKTIHDLKALLRQTFQPALSSPNFHLFLKGAKLNSQSRVCTLSISPGEFLVMIPINKKDKGRGRESNEAPFFSETSDKSSLSTLADSTWSDLMEDLSYIREIPSSGIQSANESTNTRVEKPSVTEMKQDRKGDSDKRGEMYDELMYIFLQSSCMETLFERYADKIIQFLESKSCLSDPYNGDCFLYRKGSISDSDSTSNAKSRSSCICPPWLKIILKAFSFLNFFSAFLHLRHKEITLVGLKEALVDLERIGLQINIANMEHLSALCPKVVQFSDNDKLCIRTDDTLVVYNSCVRQEEGTECYSRSSQGKFSLLKIVTGMKQREDSVKTKLWTSVKYLMEQRSNANEGFLSFSLEDLITFVKNADTHVSKIGAKQAKRMKRSCSSPSHSSAQIQCHDLNALSIIEMVGHLRDGIGSEGQIVHVEEINARKATYVQIPKELSEVTISALKRLGVDKLYSHQAESISASLSRNNVAVATMTSSGKSLCYNLPVLEVLSQNLSSCALYLFPTKALAQDQLRALLAMTEGLDAGLNIGVYDGDTSHAERTWLCDNARLMITNPDMLHISILPFHRRFSRILSNLRFVVIDEAHVYKGAFGCHTSLILRRLRRLCSHVYGSDPSFVCCTATSGNPRNHVMELANLQGLDLIQNDGSPSGEKFFILWNPSLYLKTVPEKAKENWNIDKSLEDNVVPRRSSSILEISRIFAEMIQHGLRSIAFCKTRKLCELVLCYTREILQETAPLLVESICAYRGGYTAEDRRKIEREFFGGKLHGIAATNALELGIDVGHIDGTLHLGFPGSIASLWQQAGRAGRRGNPSLAVYVAFGGPLDQYFMKNPQKLFRRSIECCHIDTQNQQVLEQHLACAALEYPLNSHYDATYFGSGLNRAISSLKSRGYITSDSSCDSVSQMWRYIGLEKMPSRSISIRAIETERYKVVDKMRNEVIEEIEESKAFFQVYEGAVYMNQGKTYLVKDLDVSSKIAWCQRADLKYYTQTRDYTDIHVPGGEIAYPAKISKSQSSTTAQTSSCKVTTTWFGFRRIWRGSNQVFDTVELSLPPYSYESQAVWIRVSQSVKKNVENKRFSFRGGLHAACHALLNVVPLYVICNLFDLAPECANPHETRYIPERILLYDQHSGGNGLSAQIQPVFSKLLGAALDLLTSCGCFGDSGCPNCVQNMDCHEYNEVLHKDAAIMIIKEVLEEEKLFFQSVPETDAS